MLSNVNLWHRIDAYLLDDPESDFSFSRRLARDNGWSHDFALRAIIEYKRFVYLACVYPEKLLTPSDEVDQVWHLHLTYTRDYWDVFCPDVLGRKLHHGPTKGGPAEDGKFHQAYNETKALYRHEFGQAPPVKFWPPASERFDKAAGFRRINTARVFILPKIVLSSSAIAAVSIALTGCGIAVSELKDKDIAVWCVFAAVSLILIFRHLFIVPRKNFLSLAWFLAMTSALTGVGAFMVGYRFHHLMMRWPDYPLNLSDSLAIVSFVVLLLILRLDWLYEKPKPKQKRTDEGSGCGSDTNSSNSSDAGNDSGGGSFGGSGSSGSGCGSGCGGD
ncbi:glycine-rich domain-containing protein [Asticcacaulis machinosus]|uniref:TIGR04222 domain-containing protein n=1 Tax=Asticcacaulis machinosus TaxID=2984211 RepID=A0ABT5HFH2_9CAUL|nr:hypothetical protein [Asticcacaulis machinosus]MDC7674768.1 hypothetical protein [Asticcacaulis machinosus]